MPGGKNVIRLCYHVQNTAHGLTEVDSVHLNTVFNSF